MTDTLFDATLMTVQTLGACQAGKATGGTAGTLIDLRSLKHSDDHWNEGTVWIGKTTDQLAPQREYAVISDFAQSTGTITFADNLSATITAGDFYHIADARYPLYSIIDAVNLVLRRVDVVTTDTTSLDSANSQTEYTLPAAVKRGGLLAVYVEMNKNDSNDNQWMKLHNWDVIPSTVGNQDTLVLPQLGAGYDIRIDYVSMHNNVYAYGDQIDESIDTGALAIHAAIECINRRMNNEKMSKYMINQFNRLTLMAEETPIQRMKPKMPTKFNIVGSVTSGENLYGDP